MILDNFDEDDFKTFLKNSRELKNNVLHHTMFY